MAFFNYIVSLSIRACVLVPLVLAIRLLIDKYPKKYSYALWLMVFASLIIKISVPGTIDTPISKAQHTIQQQYDNVLNSYAEDIVIHKDNTAEYNTAVQQGIQPIISEEAKYVVTAADNITPPKTVEKAVMPTVQIVWFVGVMIFLIVYLKNIAVILNATKFAVHYQYDIYYSEYVNSPFVFGIVKPKIYLPYTITKQQAEAVIQHERVHIKRLDYIIKPLCFFITALHWFNPFVWVAFYLMTKDMEHSCDEAVIKYADEQDKKDYCNALLQFALKDKNYRIGTVMFGESDCSSRIKNVLSFKNPKKFISILLAAVVAVVAVVAITAEKQTEQQNNQFADMTFAQLEKYDLQQKSYFKQNEELNNLLQAMDNFDDKEIEKHLEVQCSEYLSKDNAAVLKDISAHQDKLTMVYSHNKKSLCNGVVEICIQLLPDDKKNVNSGTSYSNLYMGNMLESIKSDSNFLNLKTKQLEITVIDADGITVDSYSGTNTHSFEDEETVHTVNKTAWKSAEYLFKQQPEEEFAAQKQAFDYGKSNNNFILKKFGIDNDNRLCIEYTFSDDWLLVGEGETEEKIAARTAQLNDIYADITEKVINHKDVKQYIETNNVGSAVVAFSHRFLENGIIKFPLIYNYEEPQFTHDINTEDSLPAEVNYVTMGLSCFNDTVIIGDSIADGLRVYENIENSISEIAMFETYKNMTPDIFMNEIEDLSNKTSFEKVVEQSPEKIYILMGTNALSVMSDSRFIADYGIMVRQLKEKLPNTTIYICSIPPVKEERAEKTSAYEKGNLHIVNLELQAIATLDNVYYINLHEILADTEGYLREDFAYNDGIHLEPVVYTYIIDYLREHIVVNYNDVTLENDFIIRWPTASGVRISRGFTGQYPAHDGVDIAGPYGTEIYASDDGVVTAAEYTTEGDGVYITLRHGNGWLTHYAHCCELYAEKGETVIKGQLIARMGSTGNSTGNHLHFEIIDENGISLDPYKFW